MDRFLAEEDDIRDQLNAWAAWLETARESAATQLMQLMIGANQVFALECPRDRVEDEQVERFMLGLCRFLAKKTHGVYQIDNRGFFAPDGKLLVKE